MDQQPKLQLTCIALAVAATLYGVSPAYADTPVAAEAQAAQGEAKKDEAKKDEDKKAKKKDEVEVLEVRGIRENVSKQLSIKENATGVMDVVLAEDIGKFPDENLADALQRIAGIQVTRGGGNGEAQKITVRGMEGKYVQTTWNGRKLASEDQGRDFNYDVVNSDLVGGIEVYKSAEARLSEGGIAANVNIKTRSPLSLKGFTAGGSVKANYESRTEDVLPQFSFLIGDKLANDKWAYIATVSYAKKTIRIDKMNGYGYGFPNVSDAPKGHWNWERIPTDVNGNGVIEGVDSDDVEGLPASFPTNLYFENQQGETERGGFSMALQWQATDQLQLTLDSLVSRYRNDNSFFKLGVIAYDEPWTPGLNPIKKTATDKQGRVNYVEFGDNALVEIINEWSPRTTDAVAVGFNADWNVSDTLNLTFDLASSTAENTTGKNAGFVVTRAFVDGMVIDDRAGGAVPSLKLPPLTAQSEFGAHYSYPNGYNMEDEILQWKLDGAWKPDGSLLTALYFGAGQMESTKDREYYRSINPSMFSRGGFYLESPTWTNFFGQQFPYDKSKTFEPWPGMPMFRIPADVFRAPTFNNFMKGEGVQISSWPSFDWNSLYKFYESINKDAALAAMVPLTPEEAVAKFPRGSVATSTRNSSYHVGEKVSHAYVQARIEHEMAQMPYFVDFGVRFVDVVTEARAYMADWNNAQFNANGTVDPTNGWNSRFTLLTPEGGYQSTLPSVNFRLSLLPELHLRANAARTMSRPDIDLLNPVANPQGKLGKTGKPLITLGNPGLEPYEANQYNVSLEWYFAPSSALTGTWFQNDVISFHEDHEYSGTFMGKAYDIKRTRMGAFGQVWKGFEVGYHQSFDKILPTPFDGLGVIVNYTRIDSDREDPALKLYPVEKLAKHQYNFVLFYEKDRIESRLGYNWRSETLEWVSGNRGEWNEEFGKMDFSIAYKLDENWKAFFEATNLTNERVMRYDTLKDQATYVERFGTQMSVGVRARF